MVRIGKNPKEQFSEIEAAMLLGVTVEQLRSLVRDRVLDGGDARVEDPDQPAMTFSRSDLVVLRVLASQSLTAA